MPIGEREALVTVLYENGKPLEFFVRKGNEKYCEGSIYTGLVEKVDPGLNAAFVRIGKDETGYLPLEKAEHITFCNPKKDRTIRPQDQVLVMIDKAAVKSKHRTLTGNLSISGKYLVIYSDRNGHIGISRKLPKSSAERLRETGEHFEGDHSVTFRTLSAGAEDEILLGEYGRLYGQMESILTFGIARPYGTCLFQGSSVEEKMLKILDAEELDEIVTDSEEVYADLTARVCPVLDIGPDKIRMYTDSMIDLYKLYNFSTLLDRITSKKIILRSGITLVIEPVESFTVIDVNSAGSSSKYKNADSFLPLNKEAGEGIAAQLRLRQISGIILIDFINMDSKKDEEELMRYLREVVKEDPVRTSVVDITKLGIMEVTREKRNRNIYEQLAELR